MVKFAVTNFRGFANRIEWDLSHPNGYDFNKFAITDGIVKNGVMYGPNGSGKTNFSMAVFDIANHLSSKHRKVDYHGNFVHAGKTDGVVRFEYSFRFGGDALEYAYSKDANGVLASESLAVGGKMMFERKDGALSIDKTEFPMEERTEKSLGTNANNVSIVNFLLTSYPLSESHCLMRLDRFVNSMLWISSLDIRPFIGLDMTAIDGFIISNDLVRDFSEFVCKVSGQRFEFARHDHGDKSLCCMIGGGKMPFSAIASTGTISLEVLYHWYKRMDVASLVFIDGFDASYHYELSMEVCKLLFGLKCQLYVSTHNTHLMTNDLLRPDCYFILDKGKILPLSQCTDKELREAHNIEKIYRGGGFHVG